MSIAKLYKNNIKSKFSSGQAFAEHEDLVEVLDIKFRPFMLMPHKSALQKQLLHRWIMVALRNSEGKIYIYKRPANKNPFPGLWNISTSGHVLAGEAIEDTARRKLKEDLGLGEIGLEEKGIMPAGPETQGTQGILFISSPMSALPVPKHSEIKHGFFADRDELTGLLRDMPELLTPGLIWAIKNGYL